MISSSHTGARSRGMLLGVLVLICAPLLTACGDADWDMLGSMAEDWAASNNIWDGENLNLGGLARMGVQEQIDTIFNGPPVPLDAASVVDDIRFADQLANMGAQQGGPQGLASIDEAISLRPNDWSYWEQRGALLLAEGHAELAEEAFSTSSGLARSHHAAGGDCKLYQRNLLTQREQALLTQINADYDKGRQPADDLINRLDSVRGELAILDTSAGLCG